ncbi:hypothetical protein COBT_000518 [Conglomerata obtusa]
MNFEYILQNLNDSRISGRYKHKNLAEKIEFFKTNYYNKLKYNDTDMFNIFLGKNLYQLQLYKANKDIFGDIDYKMNEAGVAHDGDSAHVEKLNLVAAITDNLEIQSDNSKIRQMYEESENYRDVTGKLDNNYKPSLIRRSIRSRSFHDDQTNVTSYNNDNQGGDLCSKKDEENATKSIDINNLDENKANDNKTENKNNKKINENNLAENNNNKKNDGKNINKINDKKTEINNNNNVYNIKVDGKVEHNKVIDKSEHNNDNINDKIENNNNKASDNKTNCITNNMDESKNNATNDNFNNNEDKNDNQDVKRNQIDSNIKTVSFDKNTQAKINETTENNTEKKSNSTVYEKLNKLPRERSRFANIGNEEILYLQFLADKKSEQPGCIDERTLKTNFNDPIIIRDIYALLTFYSDQTINWINFLTNYSQIKKERENLYHSIIDSEKLFLHFNLLLMSLEALVMISILVLTLETKLAIVSTTVSIFIFTFFPSLKKMLESFLFIINNHPFDCGDRIYWRGENLIIKRINVFYTQCIKWDGGYIVISNVVLAKDTIYNAKRSKGQKLEVCFVINREYIYSLEQIEKIFSLKFKHGTNKIQSYLFHIEEIQDSTYIKYKLIVTHTNNFQNGFYMWKVHNKYITELKELLNASNVKYLMLDVNANLHDERKHKTQQKK